MWKYLNIGGWFLLVCDFTCLCQTLRRLITLSTTTCGAGIATVTLYAILISVICLFSGFVAIVCCHLILCLLVHLSVLLKWIHDSHTFGKARFCHSVIDLLFINGDRRDCRVVIMLL